MQNGTEASRRQTAVTTEFLSAQLVALYETLQQCTASFVFSLPRVGGASTTYSFSSHSCTRLDTTLLQPPRWMLLNEVSRLPVGICTSISHVCNIAEW